MSNKQVINFQTKLFCIFGHPVHHSLSPLMHNFAFQKEKLNNLYLMFDVVDIKKAVQAFRILGFKGASVTIPHKLEIMKHLDKVDPIALKIGACNTIIQKNGRLIGYNTDWYGAMQPLNQALGKKIKDKRVLLLGAGGAARAIAFGLNHEKIPFTILNRTVAKAKSLAQETKALGFNTIDNFPKYKGYDIVINATSIGLADSNENEIPFDPKYLKNTHLIFDIVYKPQNTKLIKEAKKRGAKIIYGYQMLLYQAELQYKLFTGFDFPISDVEQILIKSFI